MMSIEQVAKQAWLAWMQAHGRPSGVLWEQMSGRDKAAWIAAAQAVRAERSPSTEVIQMTAKTKRETEAFNHSVAVAQVIDLTSLLPTCGIDHVDDVDDFVEAVASRQHPSLEPLAKVMDELREMDGLDEDDELDIGMFGDALIDDFGLLGVVLRVMTPVRGGPAASWGGYYLTWVFAPTFDDAWRHAVEWAKGRSASREGADNA